MICGIVGVRFEPFGTRWGGGGDAWGGEAPVRPFLGLPVLTINYADLVLVLGSARLLQLWDAAEMLKERPMATLLLHSSSNEESL
jgi:hypothetical protein